VARYLPPRATLAPAGALLAPIVGGAVLAWLLGGGPAVLGVVVGVMVTAPAAMLALPWPVPASLPALAAVAAALGVAVADRPLAAAGLVAATALAQAPLSIRSAGLAAMLPVAAAIGISVPAAPSALAFAGWVAAGGALAVVVGRVAPLAAPPQPVSSAVAWRHGAVVAVAVGLATTLTSERGVTHGYWLVLTLAVVLRPVRGETVPSARDRALGTIAGIALAVVVVLLLPAAVCLVLALLSGVLSTAWALAGDLRRQTLFTTPAVVLLSSSGVTSAALGLAAERLVLTVLGAVVATVAAVVLARWDAAGARPAGAGR
jgi:hypothetical protein